MTDTIMKILLYTQYFPPETNAPANRWGYFASYLTQKGYEVNVLTSFPNHPLGKIFDGYQNKWCFQEEKEEIKIIRSWTYISSSWKFFPRFLNYLSFMFSSFFNSRLIGKVDLIIASSPPLSVGIVGAFIAKKRNIPLILDLRDIWPEAAESAGYLKKNWLYRFFERWEKRIYNQALIILVNSESILKDLLCFKAVPRIKLFHLPNGADMDFFQNGIDCRFIEERYNLNNKFVVLYTGLLGFAQSPEIIAETADLLKDKNDIVFLVAGEGFLKKNLERKIKEYNLNNVILTGQRPRKEMPAFVKRADVCLVLYKNSSAFMKNVPSKIFDYMAAAKPMIINLDGEAGEIIRKSQSGLIVVPEDPAALSEGILKFYNDRFLREKAGRFAQTYAANHYNKRDIAKKLEKILKNVATKCI